MRNSLPLLSRTPAQTNRARSPSPAVATPPTIPTIRLTAATPSVAGTPSTRKNQTQTILAPKAQAESRKRVVVPKRSKLSLLSVGSKRGEKGKDLSDVARRVGAPSASTGRSFDIYVDPTDDPDIGEIVVVKKKKSRAGLDGLRWGALGDVTNTGKETEKERPVAATLKVKSEEKEKWWSIGRGRKDSKEKVKEKEKTKEKEAKSSEQSKTRSTPPEDIQISDYRQRAHSFDSGILLNTPTALSTPYESKPLPDEPTPRPAAVRTNTSPTLFGSRPNTPTSATLLAPPSADKDKPQSGSIALRAMRSMRSLANIGGWARTATPDSEEPSTDDSKKADKKKSKKEKTKSIRSSSGSSFEAGGLTPIKGAFGTFRKPAEPSGTVRTVSSQQTSSSSSSSVGQEMNRNRLSGLSVASSLKSISTVSYGSSVEPILAGTRRESKRSTGSSVHWDDQVDTVKERRPLSIESMTAKDKKQPRESRRSAEGRRRPALSVLFPETALGGHAEEQDKQPEQPQRQRQERRISDRPVLTLEVASPERDPDASAALLEVSSMESAETPVKKARPRPVSEQLLGRMRPKGIVGDEAEGMISILDAATTDLADLINRLDLEATPDASPRRGTPGTSTTVRSRLTSTTDQSPLKKAVKTLSTENSISSLRPYATSKHGAISSPTAAALLGQQIAPWSVFNAQLETVDEAKPAPVEKNCEVPVFRLKHRRTISPPAPAFDPMPVFHPLPAAKARPRPGSKSPPTSRGPTTVAQVDVAEPAHAPVVASSSMTFGVRPSKTTDGSIHSAAHSPTVMGGKHSHGHTRQKSSLVPFDVDDSTNTSVLMDSKARRALGMRGTMGSMGSLADLDPEDPDSDIPGELQVILCGHSDRGSMYTDIDSSSVVEYSPAISRVPSPRIPPSMPLPPLEPVAQELAAQIPVFRAHLIDDEDNEADIEETESSDDETKKSFDFTGELRKLNESGASDRRSFVMQLENAFMTPAKLDIKGLGSKLGFGDDLRPEVPPIPEAYRAINTVAEDLVTEPSEISLSVPEQTFEDSIISADTTQSEGLSSELSHDEGVSLKSHTSRPHLRSIPSKASDGRLNRDFKFGGKPRKSDDELKCSPEKQLTLSDVIPPPSHHTRNQSFSSIVEEDSAVLNSIFAKATELAGLSLRDERSRVDSDSSSKRRCRQDALTQLTAHARQESEASFSGMSSFSEVRRGFEFGPDRPAFYPPPGAQQNSSQASHGRHESVFSIASISSYGAVVKSGSMDPFDYGLPPRPLSEDMSMSIDDTFSFLRHEPGRRRVDSDASSFYFNASSQSSHAHRRHRRQNDSVASAMSGPPISLYNRSYSYAGHRRNDSGISGAGHRRNDSNTSASSLAHAYGTLGANGGRAAWARHQRDFSTDSTESGFSAQRLGRPGVGDKMFDSVQNYGMPLSAISASPSQSEGSRGLADRTSFDSIMDDDRRSSMGDSLFDETGHRSSMSSESVFGFDNHRQPPQPGLLPPNQFRPLSMFSVNSIHSPKHEDDTMISMLGGGHVRRRSIGSTFEASPCVRAEKRKQEGFLSHRIHTRTPSDDDYEYSAEVSPNKARIIERPSLASTYSQQFGGGRMDMAQRGLLERQSLEESCLSGEGEDTSFSVPSLGVFRKPGPASRSRRGSYAPASSGAETPPLSISDGSSVSSGSQSSIDLARLSVLLTNATNPVSGTGRTRSRARARGHGHRRRISQAQASRSSVYETIEEEVPGLSNSPSPIKMPSSVKKTDGSSLAYNSPEPAITIVEWDEEAVGPALRKYYALKDEAQETVVASQRLWEDTPFSLFALQSFDPPRHPAGMQALLEHSQKTYGPLPSDLRAQRRRSRTLSRPSPYPRSQVITLNETRPSIDVNVPSISLGAHVSHPLQEISVNANTSSNLQSPVPALPMKPFTPFVVEFKKDRSHQSAALNDSVNLGLPVPSARPRVHSNARRNALGWTKRSAGKSSQENKENATYGAMMSPAESLRIVRPRPRGRPTPTARTVRV